MDDDQARKLADALEAEGRAALEVLLPHMRARLEQVAKRRVAGGLVEDVVQETLATLWEKRSAIHGSQRLIRFAFTVLRNVIGNAYQKAATERAHRTDAGDLDQKAADAATYDPAAAVQAAEMESLVARAIERCAQRSPTSHEVLTLLWAGKSPPELQRELGGISMATVLTRVHRARKLLKELLAEELGVHVETVRTGRGAP